ncbi:MAG: hypothetical protein ISR58_05680 [Anaerolineales bacterium]|nr:hypothetical protein [Chloroflexota bacterium]MBL6980666.1 hypothetical protein [Anaerolineales bacterium]
MVNTYDGKLFWVHLAIAVLLTACGSSQAVNPSSEATNYPVSNATVIAPDEIIHVSGEGKGIAEKIFTLTESKRVRVNWDQSSEDLFILVIFRKNAGEQNRVTFEYIVGPSSGYGDFDFEPGEYAIEVEKGDGLWEVWLQEISSAGE